MTGSPTLPLSHQKETDMTLIDQPATDASAAPSAPAYRLTGVTKTYQQKGRVVQALKGVEDLAGRLVVTVDEPGEHDAVGQREDHAGQRARGERLGAGDAHPLGDEALDDVLIRLVEQTRGLAVAADRETALPRSLSGGDHLFATDAQTILLNWPVRGRRGTVPLLHMSTVHNGTQFVVADVNGDGKPDVVVGNKRGCFVHVQK